MRFAVLCVVALAQFSATNVPEVVNYDASRKCTGCVNLASNVLNSLLNYILNAGVVGGCTKLCSHAGSKPLVMACDAACSIVGIKIFVAAIKKADLDPIYFCESINACPAAPDNATATVTAVSATPTTVHKPKKVNLEVDVNVKVASGIGEFNVTVDGPVDNGPVSQTFLLPDGLPVGEQKLAVQLKTKDTGGDFPLEWHAGVYNVTFRVCQGTCGSKHPHSKDFGTKMGKFTLMVDDVAASVAALVV